jgi:hypothetical protein
MNKIICKMYYGKPVKWMDKIIPHYNTVNCDFVIFTDMPMKSKGNVKVVKSDMEWFSDFVSKKFDIDYQLYVTPNDEVYPISKHIYDLWPTQGVLFEDYHKGYEWWGHGCLDVVYGDIDKWLTPEYLSDCDIFGNDPDAICGPFSLYRNESKINHLFEEIPNWKEILAGPKVDLPMDEYWMTQAVRKARDEGRVRFKSAFWQGDNLKDNMIIHFNHSKVWPTDSQLLR